MRGWLRLTAALAAAAAALAAGIVDRTKQTALLGSILHGDAWPTLPTAWKMKLGSTAPTVTAAMTELTGTGYTAGGQTYSPNALGTATITLPSAQLSWTNGSGGSWSVVGIELVDQVPSRWVYGTWTGQPIPVANGNVFQVAAGAVTADVTAF